MRSDAEYDVAIVGAGLAGTALALRLAQLRPEMRVTLIERDRAPASRRGLSLPERATAFVARTLGLGDHLNEFHLTRLGQRLWFANGDAGQRFDECAEIGPKYLARLPGYLVDRDVLVREMQHRAGNVRPGETVSRVVREKDALHTIMLASGETVRARWLIDTASVTAAAASSVSPLIKTRWGRWRGVKDWDDAELRLRYPAWAAAVFTMRNPTVNHLVGEGWVGTLIPLRGGDVSLELTGDPSLGELPEVAVDLVEFLKERHPAAREIFKEATLIEGSSGQNDSGVRASGAALDEGSIVIPESLDADPMMMTVEAAANRIADPRGAHKPCNYSLASISPLALCRDNLSFIGEFDLMRIAYVFHLGFYHLTLARAERSEPFSRALEFIWQRCTRIAAARRRAGLMGKRNHGRRALFVSFTLNATSALPLLGATARWVWLELTEGFFA